METLIPLLKNAFGGSELCKSFNQGRTKTSGMVKDQYPIEQNYLKLKPPHLDTKEKLRRIVYIND
jgi:hypothetical protein